MLKIGGGEFSRKYATMGNRDVACFFGYDNGKSIGGLRNAECGPVPQAEGPGYVLIMAHRENATGRNEPVVGYDKSTVVEWRIFKKYVFYEARVDVSVDYISALLVAFERQVLLNDDERSSLSLGHVHAGVDDR